MLASCQKAAVHKYFFVSLEPELRSSLQPTFKYHLMHEATVQIGSGYGQEKESNKTVWGDGGIDYSC